MSSRLVGDAACVTPDLTLTLSHSHHIMHCNPVFTDTKNQVIRSLFQNQKAVFSCLQTTVLVLNFDMKTLNIKYFIITPNDNSDCAMDILFL